MTDNIPVRPSCEERIDRELAGRLEEFTPDINAWSPSQCVRYLRTHGRPAVTRDADVLREAVTEALAETCSESLLSVERFETFTLCLSWGGPADYFELHWSAQNAEWIGGRYLFEDWFDGASRKLSAEQAERIAEAFGIYPGQE